MNLLKLGAHIQKPESIAIGGRSDSTWQAALHGRAHYGRENVIMALVWSHASRFDARLRTLSLVPIFAYKYPRIFRVQGGGVLRRSFELKEEEF